MSQSQKAFRRGLLAVTAAVKTNRPRREKIAHALQHHASSFLLLLLVCLDTAAMVAEVMLEDVCPAPPHGSPGAHRLHQWERGLNLAGEAMLVVLLLHQLLLLASRGAHFFQRPLLVVDLLITGVAAGLEALEALAVVDWSHFIFVLLAWRIVRIFHGLFTVMEESSHGAEHAQHRIKGLEEQVDQLRTENRALRQKVKSQ